MSVQDASPSTSWRKLRFPSLAATARHSSGMVGSRQSSRKRLDCSREPLAPTTTSSVSRLASTAAAAMGGRKGGVVTSSEKARLRPQASTASRGMPSRRLFRAMPAWAPQERRGQGQQPSNHEDKSTFPLARLQDRLDPGLLHSSCCRLTVRRAAAFVRHARKADGAGHQHLAWPRLPAEIPATAGQHANGGDVGVGQCVVQLLGTSNVLRGGAARRRGGAG